MQCPPLNGADVQSFAKKLVAGQAREPEGRLPIRQDVLTVYFRARQCFIACASHQPMGTDTQRLRQGFEHLDRRRSHATLHAADVGLDHSTTVGQFSLAQTRGFTCLFQPGTVQHNDVVLVHALSMNENGLCGNVRSNKDTNMPQFSSKSVQYYLLYQDSGNQRLLSTCKLSIGCFSRTPVTRGRV